ncbi:ABC transporter ATP-binding protein [Sulfurimonas sp.]|jgi:putative ABC transport system ATP-binding protein|uniref:ABC transporter ATP-binding protein n=1 Tax=Sulfurimonas sp. TaxID=2022749 RepID=UPI0025CC881D|nr:ABC transporter ATP-binding protein [Sulfurimonas sp.]MCK9473717.1 ABC transporter ATP-binding protein [Sulfurimonas sp.]MDD3505555.1 ABC transporter ATP-binding protein [Sulfurimonas sp.]
MSKQSAIKVKNLVKNFGKDDNLVRVIENASFEIQKGEVVALIAPSGAGKTTLLMMIGCVIEPTSGEIWLGENMVYKDKWLAKDTRKIRREKIGFIFQAHYLVPFLNVLENITLLPQANKVSEEDALKKAMELLKYFEIDDKAYNMSSQLSGGQNQRVAIARALANNPEIILADEPTAALDGERAVSVIKMLKKIALEQNVAIITVTHDERILPYCDRIMKIQNRGIIFHDLNDEDIL